MSLTVGNAPFARHPAGEFSDLEKEEILYLDEAKKRIRCVFNDHVVADTTSAKFLHRTGQLLSYLIPRDDVESECLVETDRVDEDALTGPCRIWDLQAEGKTAEGAARTFESPPASGPDLEDLVRFEWDAIDAWFEEDEQIYVHPRDPYHRIDVRRTSRHVRVFVDDEIVAETRRPRLLFETSLPIRYYIPREDVRTEFLTSSTHRTRCPYKGQASYWDVEVNGERHDNLIWCYEEALSAATKVEGYLSLYQEDDAVRIEDELDV